MSYNIYEITKRLHIENNMFLLNQHQPKMDMAAGNSSNGGNPGGEGKEKPVKMKIFLNFNRTNYKLMILSLSNGFLLFYIQEKEATPMIKVLPWFFEEDEKRLR